MGCADRRVGVRGVGDWVVWLLNPALRQGSVRLRGLKGRSAWDGGLGGVVGWNLTLRRGSEQFHRPKGGCAGWVIGGWRRVEPHLAAWIGGAARA